MQSTKRRLRCRYPSLFETSAADLHTFRAFTDYKNPVHVYLLAAVFRLTGPSIAVARSLSAAAGVLTALVLGLLGMRLASTPKARRNVGLIVMATPARR